MSLATEQMLGTSADTTVLSMSRKRIRIHETLSQVATDTSQAQVMEVTATSPSQQSQLTVGDWPVPEPNGITCSESHPLWDTLCRISLELPWQVQDAFLLEDVIGCSSACCIAVSTQGRVLCQSHRCGLQCHGGGTQWMESNLDIAHNPAVISRGHPILVMQDSTWASCLVQICILHDAQIEVTDQGVVRVGGVELWSRERARDTQGWYELEPEPTLEHIQAGQFYCGVPIMHVVQLNDIWTSPHKWRSCDWMTFVMLRERLEHMQRRHWVDDFPSECLYVGDVTAEHLDLCQRVMSYWSKMEDVDRAPWPLLTSYYLYRDWKDPHWRKATIKKAAAEKAGT